MNYYVPQQESFSFCYFIIPPFYTVNSQIHQQDHPNLNKNDGAEIFKQNSQQRQAICLNKQDLLQKGYQQNKKSWTEAQDNLLLELCQDQNARFQEIAQNIPGRNAKMCYSRYRRLTNRVKQCWTELQNAQLINLVNKYGQNWKQIANFFKKRNDKQLKDHYVNYLRPNLNKGEWSVQDDLMLIRLINTYGKNWQIIQEKMPDRSRNQIKNRYFGRIKKFDDQKRQKRLVQE